MLSKVRSKYEEKQETRIATITRQLSAPHVFFLYGDIPFDLDLYSKKGMMFCENNSLNGLKTCRRVTKSNSFIHFDLVNEGIAQITDFQFLIDRIRSMTAASMHDHPQFRAIHALANQLQTYQNRVQQSFTTTKAITASSPSISNTATPPTFQASNISTNHKNQPQSSYLTSPINPARTFQQNLLEQESDYDESNMNVDGSQINSAAVQEHEQSQSEQANKPSSSSQTNNDQSFSTQSSKISLEGIFEKANAILDGLIRNQSPFMHYQIYHKTASSLSAVRSGVCSIGLQNFNINVDLFEQSMLRNNHYPVNRDENGMTLLFRYLQKINIDLAEHARAGIPVESTAVKINFKGFHFDIIESTTFHSLYEDASNQFFLVAYQFKINNAPLDQAAIQSAFASASAVKSMTNSISQQNPSRKQQLLREQKQPTKQEEFYQNSMLNNNKSDSYNTSKQQILTSNSIIQSTSSMESDLQEHPSPPLPPQLLSMKDNGVYQKKAQQFIQNFYSSKEPEIKKQQKFDKVLHNMLLKKQQKLNVKLV